jgi:hypothetical protein
MPGDGDNERLQQGDRYEPISKNIINHDRFTKVLKRVLGELVFQHNTKRKA